MDGSRDSQLDIGHSKILHYVANEESSCIVHWQSFNIWSPASEQMWGAFSAVALYFSPWMGPFVKG